MSSQPLWRRWFSRAAVVAVLAGVSAAMVVPDADARRLGGGKSFGRQSQNVNRQATPPSNAQQQNQAAPAQQQAAQQPRNRWLGPLAGLAAGLGIAALLSHFGLVGPLASAIGGLLVILLLVLAGVFIWRMLRGPRSQATARERMAPAYEYAGGGSDGGSPVPGTQRALGSGRPGSVASMDYASGAASTAQAAPWGVPADFDTDGFLRNAKLYFIRLQADWDSKNLDDIREFTTPEVFAEIKMQLEEEKGAQNRTDVVDLDAQLLGIEETDNVYVASARFEGRIRENDNPTAEPFVEVWNLVKPKSGRSGWLLAGIQQVS